MKIIRISPVCRLSLHTFTVHSILFPTRMTMKFLKISKISLYGSSCCSKSNYHEPHATHWRGHTTSLIDWEISSNILSLKANGHRIYGFFFSDYIENVWKISTFAKYRRTVQAFNHKDHGFKIRSNCSNTVSASFAHFCCYYKSLFHPHSDRFLRSCATRNFRVTRNFHKATLGIGTTTEHRTMPESCTVQPSWS